jgi:prepilin-type N-terminal cleavage/methylation domain-containing protein
MSIANNKKGFTLVELLIVIAILAVLSTATVVVLNPAELLAQARDSQRMQDLAGIQTALAFYISQASPIEICKGSATNGCSAGGRCMVDPGALNGPFSTATCAGIITDRTVTGTAGWVDVPLSGLIGGSPISVLPIDPTTNSSTYFYAYKANDTNKTFKLVGRLESSKHRGKMATDGGTKNTCSTYIENTCYYEVGTDLAL